MLALLIAFGGLGCTKKTGNANSDSTTTGAGTATTQLQPPIVAPGPPPAAGPIRVTSSSQPADRISVSAVWAGPSINQTVTVTTSAGGATLASFSNAVGGTTSATLPGPGIGVTYTITSLVNGIPYTGVTNVPNNPNEPNIVSTYTDGGGNSVVVTVSDLP